MKKMKILYLITKADVGGAQKYVADLARTLPSDRFDSKIVYGGKDLRWLSNATRPWLLFANDWLAIAEIVRLLRREQPDILHLNSSKAGILGTLAAQIYKVKSRKSRPKADQPWAGKVKYPPVRVVFTAHGWVFNPTNAIAAPVRWFYIALHIFAARFQDAIICVSEYDAALARRFHITPDRKIHMIHNGIDPSLKFLEKEKAREEILHKLTTNNKQQTTNTVWIGSIGRLVKEKNYETFIRAAAQVPRAAFFIIGNGPELKKLKAESRMSKVDDRFFFIDPTGDDARYLKAFDIFVMSSIKEGLPYILLEAMAAELPIIVTEAGGIPEIIKNHENGIMVTQRDPAQLAHAITGLLANPQIAREIEKTAHDAVRHSFNLRTMVKKTEEVYEKVVSRTSNV